MKKYTSLFLIICMLCCFWGCKESAEKTSSGSDDVSGTVSATDTQQTSDVSDTDSGKESQTSSTPQSEISKTVSDVTSPDPEITQVTDDKVTSRLIKGINVSGPLEATGDINYSSWIFDKQYFTLIVEQGFDHVRIPVNFGAHIGDAPDYLIDIEFLRAVDVTVNNALNAGLVAVIDFHGWTGNLTNDFENSKEIFYKIWEQVAARYQTYPETLMFELVNEPNKPMTDNQLNELQKETVSRIRKTNPTRTIALALNENNGAWKLWDTWSPSDDKNIMMSVHHYTPMRFTHQGANWIEGYEQTVKITDSILKELEGQIAACRNYEQRTGRKVWISEWGVYLGKADPNDVAAYLDHFSAYCKDNRVAYCYWEFCSGYGAFDLGDGKWKDFIVNNLH